jgi:hypothetical protein
MPIKVILPPTLIKRLQESLTEFETQLQKIQKESDTVQSLLIEGYLASFPQEINSVKRTSFNELEVEFKESEPNT